MQSYGSFLTYLSSRPPILRSACVTEAAIGAVEGRSSCFFMVNRGADGGGIIPSSAFGVAKPQQMVDIEATAEASSVEGTVMGELPSLLVADMAAKVTHAIVSALEGCSDTIVVGGGDSAINLMLKGEVKLGENEVPIEDEDNMFALITSSMRSALIQQTEFSSGDYVAVKHGNRDYKVWRWAGKNWLVGPPYLQHSYVFHRHALGHAFDFVALDAPGAVTSGIDPKTGCGWMKAKTVHLATVLQPKGIARIGGKQ